MFCFSCFVVKGFTLEFFLFFLGGGCQKVIINVKQFSLFFFHSSFSTTYDITSPKGPNLSSPPPLERALSSLVVVCGGAKVTLTAHSGVPTSPARGLKGQGSHGVPRYGSKQTFSRELGGGALQGYLASCVNYEKSCAARFFFCPKWPHLYYSENSLD